MFKLRDLNFGDGSKNLSLFCVIKIEFYFYILPKNAVSNVTITSTSNVFRILDYNTSTGLILALSRDIEQTFTISCSGYITQTVTYYGDDTTFNVTLTPFIAILVFLLTLALLGIFKF